MQLLHRSAVDIEVTEHKRQDIRLKLCHPNCKTMKTIIFIATVIILAAARPDGENAEIVKSELINDGVNPWHHR